jgi:hypothetical protein
MWIMIIVTFLDLFQASRTAKKDQAHGISLPTRSKHTSPSFPNIHVFLEGQKPVRCMPLVIFFASCFVIRQREGRRYNWFFAYFCFGRKNEWTILFIFWGFRGDTENPRSWNVRWTLFCNSTTSLNVEANFLKRTRSEFSRGTLESGGALNHVHSITKTVFWLLKKHVLTKDWASSNFKICYRAWVLWSERHLPTTVSKAFKKAVSNWGRDSKAGIGALFHTSSFDAVPLEAQKFRSKGLPNVP